MATVYYPGFQAVRITAAGVRTLVTSATITAYNVTTSTSLSSIASDTSGNVAGGSVTATAGDIIRFGHATYPEKIYFTLTATAAEAYTHQDNIEIAFVMENLATNTIAGEMVELYAQDLNNLTVTPWKIGEGYSGTTVKIPYQSNVAKSLRIFPRTIAKNLSRVRSSFQITTNAKDITIPSTDQVTLLADDAWESVRRNSTDDAFEGYDTRASRPLFEFFQTRTTTLTTEQTLFLYQVGRSQFIVNGDRILAEFSGTLAATANEKYVRVKFAGSTIFDSSDINVNLGNSVHWTARISITRKSISVVRCAVAFTVYGFDSYSKYTEITGLDLPPDVSTSGTPYDLSVTLETPTVAGDATLTMGEGRFVNAGAAAIVSTSLWAYYESRSFNGAGVALPADGANITTSWQDLSGNGRHMTVTGTPTFETAELNGLGVVRLGADSNDYFTIPTLAALTSGTIFIVQKVTDVTTNAGHKLGSYAGNDGYYPYEPDVPDGIYETFGSTDRKTCGGSKVTITNWHVTHMQSATNNWNLWQDGMLVHNDATHTVGFGTAPLIGSNGTAYMKADIAAVYIFSNNMSAANAAAMYRYLGQVWGV